MNDLATRPGTELATDIGETTEISWTAPAEMDFPTFQAIGNTFQQIKESLSWWLGDWLHAGEERFGESAYQAVPDNGKSYETLLKFKAVAFRVPKHIRRSDLSWTHHFYVAYVPEEQRGYLLEMAANIGLTSRELKDVTKLDDDTRYQFILAVESYTTEQGPMSRDTFFNLLNRFRLGEVDDRRDRDDDEDDDDDEDSPLDDADTRPVEFDDVTDFWENAGVPLQSIGTNQAVWQGMIVYAAMNDKGKAVLIWEESNHAE